MIDGVTGGIMWDALIRSGVGLHSHVSLSPQENFLRMARRIWQYRNHFPPNIVVIAALNGGCDNDEIREHVPAAD